MPRSRPSAQADVKAYGDVQHWLSPLIGWLRMDQHTQTPTTEQQISLITHRVYTALRALDGTPHGPLHAAVETAHQIAVDEQTAAFSGIPVDQQRLLDALTAAVALARTLDKDSA